MSEQHNGGSRRIVDNVMILAGGSGTRLWPASTREIPKQFMPVRDGKTLLRLTVERAAALNPERIMIVTLAAQADQAAAELSLFLNETDLPVPELLVLPEPAARNTAPAIASGAACFSALGSAAETVLVLPADHLIEPLSSFCGDVAAAAELARDGSIVTFGIHPSRPETGYGYIEAGEAVAAAGAAGRRVLRFREKPDAGTARGFIEAGNFTWNSGMFLFTLELFAAELEAHAPQVARLYRDLARLEMPSDSSAVRRVLDNPAVPALYTEAPKISVDYALMEKTSRAAVLAASFKWNDIGSWDEYSRVFPQDAPALAENPAGKNGNNFVLSELPVSLVGVEDLIVVVRNGRVLVCRRGESQGVKENLDRLPEEWR